jgi:hypothetical protein
MRKLVFLLLILQALHSGEFAQAQSAPHEHDTSGTSYRIHVTINSAGKVRVVVDNPENLRYKIEIADHRNRIVYQEFTSNDHYRRHIDISSILGDTAQIILSIDKKRFVYHIEGEKIINAYKVNAVVAQR